MDCECEPLGVVPLGASVHFKAGPFKNEADVVINLSAWTVTLYLGPPNDAEAREIAASGTSDGYMTCTTDPGEIDEIDIWTARLMATNGTVTRASEVMRVRVEDVLP